MLQGGCWGWKSYAVEFLEPVRVCDEVSVFCELADQGRNSIEVRIAVLARNGRRKEPSKDTDGLFAYVAVDDGGKPRSDRG